MCLEDFENRAQLFRHMAEEKQWLPKVMWSIIKD